MKPNLSVSTIDPNKVHALLDRRQAVRVRTHYPVTYGDEATPQLSKGFLRDMSKTGCSIVSEVSPSPGSMITLTLQLDDGKPPIRLSSTTICWSALDRFGVMFPEMTAEERKRLQEIVWKRVTLSEGTRQRTAFRIL